jgi:hypothetical protein
LYRVNTAVPRPFTQRAYRLALISIVVSLAFAFALAQRAEAITPTIVNSGTNQWVESLAVPGEDTGNNFRTTVLVRHDPGRSVTGLRVDKDFDGSDETGTAGITAVTSQQPVVINGFTYSRVSLSTPISYPDFRCVSFSGPLRRTDDVIRLRARLDNGTETGAVSQDIFTIADGQCTGAEDFPFLKNQTQTATSVNPGSSVSFTFQGDDPDSTGCDVFSGVNYRVRRLQDGVIVKPEVNFDVPDADNTDRTLSVTFQSAWGRGRYVVEGEALCDESTTNPNDGKYFWIGTVDMNGGDPTGTLSVPNRPTAGQTITASLSSLADAAADGSGSVQMIEWDITNDGTYESRELSDPVGTAFTTAQLQRSIVTGLTPGTYTVKARITDNGAMNGADNVRNQTVLTDTYVVNSAPVVNDQTVATEAGTPVPIPLGATDANSDPLTYSVTASPPASAGTVSDDTTSTPTFTPAAGFAGTSSFTVKAADAFGGSDTATITVNVRPNTQIDSGPPESPTTSNSTSPSFTFSSPEAAVGGITFECRWDSAPFTPCTSGSAFPVVGDGDHTFQVRAVKGALADGTPAERKIRLDTTAPETNITAKPADPSNSGAFNFQSPTDPGAPPAGATFKCSIDGAGYQPCSAPRIFQDADLTQGSHTFKVKAVDPAGNEDPTPSEWTWVYDSQRPNTSITLPVPLGLTNSKNADFSFIGEDTAGGTGVASFRCLQFSGPEANPIASDPDDPCASPKSYSNLPDGAQTFRVWAKDVAGNEDASAAFYEWTIDTVAPDGTVINGGPAELSYTNDPTPTFDVAYVPGEQPVSLQCSVDGNPTWEPCGAGYTPTVTGDGQHTLRARAVDAAGNPETTPATRTWNLDTVRPTVIPVEAPPVSSTSRDATIKFTSDDATDATYTCQLDAGTVETGCLSPKSYSNLSDNPHSVVVKTTDRAGNESDPYTFAWVVDATLPTGTTIDTKPDNPSKSSSATFTFSNSTPDVDHFQCNLDAGGWSTCISGVTFPGLGDAPHTFEVRAVDGFGNIEASPPSYGWVIDTAEPDTSYDTKPPAFTNAATAPFDLASTESPVGYECKLPGSADFSPCTEVFSLTLPEGDYSVLARAVDAAGNKDSTPAQADFTVDRTDPPTTIDDGPTGFVSSKTATFQFSSDELGTSECRIDSSNPSDWEACSTGKQYTGLAEGEHTFEVRAIDRAGNKDASPADRTWNVDTVDPSATITGKPASLSNTRDPQFTFTSDEDPNVTYTCTLDGTDAPCTTPKDYTGLADGQHTFKVRATDRASNSSPQDSYTWDLDATPPSGTTIDGGPTGTVGVPTASMTFSNPEAGVALECKLDGGAFTACTSPRALSTLPEGEHTFQVRAQDPAGNIEVTPASRTWTVDLSAPDTSLTDGPSGTTANGNASFAFNASESGAGYQCSLDGTQWEPCTSRKDYSSLADGQHAFRVRARDAVGNVDPTPAERAWTIATPRSNPAPIEPPKVDPCTFRGLAAGCEDTRAGARLTVAGKGGDATASTAGSPELSSAALTLRSGAKVKIATALGGKQVGTFSLADRRGSAVKTGKLTLPKKPKGTITLFSAAGLKITLTGQTVTLTGLPTRVYRVAITLNGKKTGVLVPSNPCSALSWRAVLTDRLGAKQTVDAKGTCPPTTGAKR